MKILIVEDDTDKRRLVTKALSSVVGVEDDSFSHAIDVRTAKQLLRKETFDLLVLDISLPVSVEQEAQRDAGLDLLEELFARPAYKIPSHIVGLTGFDEVIQSASGRFSTLALNIIKYDASSDEWSRLLQARARHIVSAKAAQDSVSKEYLSHLAIVCALETPELEAVLKIGWGWEQCHQPGDDSIYHRGEFERDGQKHRVYAVAAARMGMPAAAIATSKIISAFRPAYIAMAGIAAGIPSRTKMGDVIASDPCWDYGSGKWITKDGLNIFLPSPHQLGLDTKIRSFIKQIASDEQLLARIRRDWPGDKPEHNLCVRIGPLASGAAVLADGVTAERVGGQHRELLGIEMESYAVFAAAVESSTPKPLPFSLKAVVDFADGNKKDQYQRYGAYASAQVLRVLAEKLA